MDLNKLREELDAIELARYLECQIAQAEPWAHLNHLDFELKQRSDALLRLPADDARRPEIDREICALSAERSQLIAEHPHLVPIRIPDLRQDSIACASANASEQEQSKEPLERGIEQVNSVVSPQGGSILEQQAQRDAGQQASAVSTNSSSVEGQLPPPRRKRGRPQKISDDLKEKALGVEGARQRAQILYQKNYPTPQEIKNVYSILRYHRAHKKTREESR